MCVFVSAISCQVNCEESLKFALTHFDDSGGSVVGVVVVPVSHLGLTVVPHDLTDTPRPGNGESLCTVAVATLPGRVGRSEFIISTHLLPCLLLLLALWPQNLFDDDELSQTLAIIPIFAWAKVKRQT